MIEVTIITKTTANSLVGQAYSENLMYNPQKDNTGVWFVSMEEGSTLEEELIVGVMNFDDLSIDEIEP